MESIANVPAGTYLVWAQTWIYDSSTGVGKCRIAVNGSADLSTATPYDISQTNANLTLVTPETLTGGGSTVAVECSSTDSGSAAGVHLALVTIDALN